MTIHSITWETGISLNTGFGSTTFRREELQRGFDPDACVYVQHEPAVRGKVYIEPAVDPPPDIVIEIDDPTGARHNSLSKLLIYAQFGAPEVWRYDGRRLEMLRLTGDTYAAHDENQALPGVTAAALTRLLTESATMARIEWLRHVRAWARALASR